MIKTAVKNVYVGQQCMYKGELCVRCGGFQPTGYVILQTVEPPTTLHKLKYDKEVELCLE